MKRLFSVLILVCMLVTVCACKQEAPRGEEPDGADSNVSGGEASDFGGENLDAPVCTKESVDEFFTVLKSQQQEGSLSNAPFSKEYCYNVTPLRVAEETEIQIFKFSDSCAFFAFMDGVVYPLGAYVGGYGFVNAVPCDFDGDGNVDLLIASSWGSGLHRSILSVWNSQTKELTEIYTTGNSEDPQIDLIVTNDDDTNIYGVYSVRIIVEDNNFANLSYETIAQIGTVRGENGAALLQSLPT